jgi:hypothetical protein
VAVRCETSLESDVQQGSAEALVPVLSDRLVMLRRSGLKSCRIAGISRGARTASAVFQGYAAVSNILIAVAMNIAPAIYGHAYL